MMREFLDKIFNNRKATISIPIIIALLIYVLLILFSTGEERNTYAIQVPIISVFCYFGVFFVIYIQIKNPLCPKKFLDFFEVLATIVSSIAAVLFTISGLINDIQDLVSVILACLVFSSLSWVHSKRNC